VRLIPILIFSTMAMASAAVDPLNLSFTGDLDELEALLAGADIGLVNRSAAGAARSGADPGIEPPFLHLLRNESIFLDFANLTAPAFPLTFGADAAENESFFEILLRDWW
jgi:hypothetical protein